MTIALRYYDLDDLADRINTTFYNHELKHSGSNFPKINAWLEKAKDETCKNKLIIQASLSGYRPEDVEITVDATESTLTFESAKNTENDETEYFIREIKKSAFSRKLVLHNSINLNSYDSKYENGLVTISFDLKTDEELGRRKIKIGEN